MSFRVSHMSDMTYLELILEILPQRCLLWWYSTRTVEYPELRARRSRKFSLLLLAFIAILVENPFSPSESPRIFYRPCRIIKNSYIVPQATYGEREWIAHYIFSQLRHPTANRCRYSDVNTYKLRWKMISIIFEQIILLFETKGLCPIMGR